MCVDVSLSWVQCQHETTARALEEITGVLQVNTTGGRQNTAVTNRHRPPTPGHNVARIKHLVV